MMFFVLAAALSLAVATFLAAPLLRLRDVTLAVAAGGGALLVAVAVYLAVGSPGLATLGGRADDPRALEPMVAVLETRIAADPDDIDARLELAELRLAQADYAGAAEVYEAIAATGADLPGLQSARGEALVFARGGVVDADAQAAFDAALAADPGDMRARYYVVEAAFQAGRAEDALQGWAAMAEDAAPGAPWLAIVARRLDDALISEGRSLESLDVSDRALAALDAARSGAAAPEEEMSEEEIAAMVEGMVDGLRARLDETPDDIEGWRMLARSYVVLGRDPELAEALGHVAALDPENVTAARDYAYALWRLRGADTPIGADLAAALERLHALDETDVFARLGLGEAALAAGDSASATAFLEGLAADESAPEPVRARARMLLSGEEGE